MKALSTIIITRSPSNVKKERPIRNKEGKRTLATNDLGLGEEALEGEELIRGDEDLVVNLEGGGNHAVLELDGEVELVHGTQDLVDLADLGLVLEVDGGVEVGDLDVCRLADHLALAGVHELTDLYNEHREGVMSWLALLSFQAFDQRNVLCQRIVTRLIGAKCAPDLQETDCPQRKLLLRLTVSMIVQLAKMSTIQHYKFQDRSMSQARRIEKWI